MVFATLELVAVVAELATFPEVLIVESLVSTILALDEILLSTISELDKLPEASFFTTPAEVNALIDTVPLEDILMRSKAFVLNNKLPDVVDKPAVVLPVNTSDG